MNPGIRILPLPRANGLPGGWMSGWRSGLILVLWMGKYPWRWINHKLANGIKMWKGNGNTIRLLFSLKIPKLVRQERREQVKTIVMEHFNAILFHKSGPTNKQHTNQLTPYKFRKFKKKKSKYYLLQYYFWRLSGDGKVGRKPDREVASEVKWLWWHSIEVVVSVSYCQ